MSVIFSLFAVKFALRFAGYEPLKAMAAGKDLVLRRSEHPDTGYELIQGAEGRAFKTDVKVNSLGFRSLEPDRSGDARRVLFLGDSITFGSELLAGTAWPELMATRLESRDPRFDVQNLALSGYDDVQELAVLEHRGLTLSPGLVVIGFCLNDVGVVSANFEYHERAYAWAQSSLAGSRVGQLLLTIADRLLGRRFEAEANEPDVFAARHAGHISAIGEDEMRLRGLVREVTDRPPSAWYGDADRIGRLRYVLERLTALRDQYAFRLQIVVFPLHETAADGTYPHWVAYAIVGLEAERMRIPVLDLAGPFQREGLVELRNDPDDPVHPSPRGHEIAAEKVWESWLNLRVI
ncbi:MAG: SGNH/GDSL hydrolase family protein [Gammaproteobacteria bacterium]|nr:SGNH/GDSL hydrolase family protein [Gammaproteobacteria bacterium]